MTVKYIQEKEVKRREGKISAESLGFEKKITQTGEKNSSIIINRVKIIYFA